MPRIASHHADDPWRPSCAWPDDCTVQWGEGGLVLGREGSYETAFFEAFQGGGFIRGEGATLAEAEADAFRHYERERRCFEDGGHRLSRARRVTKKDGSLGVTIYTNGACFCTRCGAFASKAMPQVVELGAWRRPLSAAELDMLAGGYARPRERLRPETDEERGRADRYRRRMELRARVHGIDLPDWRDPAYAADDPLSCKPALNRYAADCNEAVLTYYVREYRRLWEELRDAEAIQQVFGGLAISGLHRAAIKAGLIAEAPRAEQDEDETPGQPPLRLTPVMPCCWQ